MKTEIEIHDALLRQAAESGSAHGQTLDVVVELALRQFLLTPRRTESQFRLRKHAFGGDGLQPGLGDGDWDRIRDLSYQRNG